MLSDIRPIDTQSWKKLEAHFQEIKNKHLKYLFEEDPHRAEKFSIAWEDFFIDFSKTHITSETLRLLTDLAMECKVPDAIEHMFKGDKINETEKRSVLHIALRHQGTESIYSDGEDVLPEIREVLNQMKDFSEKVRNGEWKGYTGKAIRNIVNIGIGGSDLGPVMVCKALQHYGHERLQMFFVSNVDGTHIHQTLKNLNPEETLFLVVSKTFTTQETMANAETARKWFLESGAEGKDIAKHFVAVSTHADAVVRFGINPQNMFRFWDFVGGRFSLWSAVGLSIAIYTGFENFSQLLKGAWSMDQHFRTAPPEHNLPIILALLGIWYVNFWNCTTEAILPYDQYLERLPAYLQQAVMESNGKNTDRGGRPVEWKTSPIIWGEPGTNGQHSFYQLIHQGTQMIPTLFMAAAKPLNEVGNHHNLLLSNFFAQPEALMNGKTPEEVYQEMKDRGIPEQEIEFLLPFRVFPGNRPSISIIYKQLTPYNLGALIALFEHRIFVQGVIWNIFSFDQWGVELGKVLANRILPELSNDQEISTHDSSTRLLINQLKRMRKG